MACLGGGGKTKPKQYKWALFTTFCISECRLWKQVMTDTTKALLILSWELGDFNLTHKHPHNASPNGLMPVSCLDWNTPSKWVINPSSKKTPNPHNLWTGTEQLLRLTPQRGWTGSTPSCTRIQGRKVAIWGSRAQTFLSTPQQRPKLTSTGCIVASNHRLPWGGGSLHQ